MLYRRIRRQTAVLVSIALLSSVATAVVTISDAPPASAADDGSVDLSFTGPDTILLGENAVYTLSATNNGATSDAYNLSWRLVLPAGASLVTSDLGNPKTFENEPAAGQTTLVWTNVEDLQVNVTKTHTVEIEFAHPTWEVALEPELEAGAYASGNPRQIPDFAADGTHNDTADTTAFDEVTNTTRIEAIELTKTEPNTESELLRGVHDEWTTYSLNVQNNFVNPTGTIVVMDYLPAGLEFLGCGAVDNTAAIPITNLGGLTTDEYEGSGPLGAGVTPADPTGNGVTAICVVPDEVETVTLAADDEFDGLAAGVYTRLRWEIEAGDGIDGDNDGVLVAGEAFELMYAAGIPLRENVAFATPLFPGSASGEMANLDNNTGPLTTDEQQLRNWGRATGVYNPGGLDLPTVSEDDETVTAEDLSIHKSVDDDVFIQGETPRWTMLIETGEYRDASALVVTDTLPDGLCPVLIGTNPETVAPIGAECAAGAGPDPLVDGGATDPDIITENSDGSWTLVWNTLPTMTESDEITIEFSAVVREFYQETFDDALPVVGGDSWTNDVGIIGTTDPLTDGGGNEPDRATETDTVDESSAGQTSNTVVISKRISEPAPAGDSLSCDTATFVQSTFDASDAIPFMALGYKPGDRICYQLDIDFTLGLDWRNSIVTDFIPPNTAFEQFWGLSPTTGATAANTVTIDDAELVDYDGGGADDAIVWTLGTDPGSGDLMVAENSEEFQVVFSVLATGDPRDANDVDVIENLVKLTHQNSASLGSETFSSRDLADFGFIEPHVVIDKTNAPDGGTLDDGTESGVQGSAFDFAVTVSNDVAPVDAGGPQDDHRTAFDIEVWDIIPEPLVCADLSGFSVSTGEVATCYDDGDGGYPLGGQSTDGQSVIEWTIAELAPGESSTLTYDLDVPLDVVAGLELVNETGVRDFDAPPGNAGTTVTFVPSDNIDEDAPASNVGPIDDTATVQIDDVVIVKGQTSSDTDATNRSGADSQDTGEQDATIGESITYRFDVTIPEGIDLWNAEITDPLPDETSFVSLDDGALSLDDGATTTPLTITNAATGDGYFDLGVVGPSADDIVITLVGDTLTGTFPDEWDNPIAALDDLLWIEFTVVVDNTAGNDRGDNIDNRVSADWNLTDGGTPAPQARSNRARTKLVEPDLSITKTDDGTDTDTPTDDESNVGPGDTVEYTVTVGNDVDDDDADASVAYDVVVTDVVPFGLTFVAFDAGNPVTGSFTADTPVGSEGTLTWTIDEIGKDETVDLTYTVTVDPDQVAASRLTNTVTATTTSREQDSPSDERTAANDPAGDVEYTVSATDTVELPVAGIVKDIAPFGAPDVDINDYPVGAEVAFELEITIPDGIIAYDTTVFDTLPGFLQFDSYGAPSVSGGECDLAGTDTDLSGADIIGLEADGQTIGWWVDDLEADGADCTITLPYTTHVDISATSASSGSNSATLRWNDTDDVVTDPDEVDDLSGVVWDVVDGPVSEPVNVVEPQLALDKAVVVLTPAVTVCEPVPDADTCDTTPGADHRFTVTVTNTSGTDAHDLTIVDTLPATGTDEPRNFTGATPTYDAAARTLTWTFPGPLAAGDSTAFTYDITVDGADSLTDGQVLINTADVTEYYGMASADRAAAPDPSDVPTYGGARGPVPDDTVALTIQNADLGNRIWFDIDADGVQDPDEPGIPGVGVTVSFTDPVDGSPRTLTTTTDDDGRYGFAGLPLDVDYTVTVDESTLPAGTTQTFELVDDPDPTDTQAANRSGDPLDGEVADIRLDATTTSYLDVDFGYVGAALAADLAIEKTSAGAFAVSRENTWTLTVTNRGRTAATGTITVTDPLPTGIDFVRVEGDGWTCSETTGTVTCSIAGPLGPGVSSSADLIVFVPVASAGATLTNTATVDHTDSAPDPDPTNDTDADTVSVPLALLDLEKSLVDDGLVAGADVTWLIAVTNLGPSPTTGTVTVVDDLPAGLTHVSNDSDVLDCAVAGQAVTCTTDSVLAVGDTIELRIVTTVVAEPGTTVLNEATVTGGTSIDGELLPEDVIDEITEDLTDPDSNLDEILGIDLPDDGDIDTTDDASQPTLAFTGSSTVWLALVAAALVVLGLAFQLVGRRKDPILPEGAPS